MSPDTSENPIGSPTARRRLYIGLAVLGLVLSIVLIVVLAVQVGGGAPVAAPPTSTVSATAPPATSAPATPEPSDPATRPPDTPTPTSTPPGQDAAPGVPRPSSCDELYSPVMVQALSGLALNPEWSQDPEAGVSHGTDDTALRAVIDSADHLTCVWGSPYGGSDTGIITTLAWVTPQQSAAVEDRLVATGLKCFAQSDGVRCVIQTNTLDGAFGESHFLRDGIWLATKYTNAGPLGYTQDMVNNLWATV